MSRRASLPGITVSVSSSIANRQVVTSTSDLPAPTAGVRTLLANTEYIIYGNINLGTDILALSDNTIIRGGKSQDLDGFTTNNASGLIGLASATDEARVERIFLTNTGGPAYEISNAGLQGAIRSEDVWQVGCSGPAILEGMAVFSSFRGSIIGDGGYAFDGNMGSIVLENEGSQANPTGFIYASFAATCAANLIILRNIILSLPDPTSIGFDIDSSLLAGGRGVVNSCIFFGTGTPRAGTVDETTSGWSWRNNTALSDSRVSTFGVFDSGTPTTIAITTPGVYEDVAVTYTTSSISRMTDLGSGVYRYDGPDPVEVTIYGSVSVESATGGSKLVGLGISINGASPVATQRAFSVGSNPNQQAVAFRIQLTTNDTVRLAIANLTDTVDLDIYSAELTLE